MRLNNTEINNLAIYTGVKTDALSRFIRKYNLNVTNLERDVMKYKRIRLDLAAAISGYDDNEIAQDIVRKYSLDESRRATEFFDSKHGKAIFNLLKRNGKVFNRELVVQYFDQLNTNDLKWSRLMDFIASDLGLNYAIYSTFEEQERDMLDAIEKLYNQYQTSDTKLIISKNAINEMVEKAIQPDIEIDQERKKMKRIVIDVVQFEALLNHVLNPHNTMVTITSDDNADSYTFEVNTDKMKMFLDFIKTLPTLRVIQLRKDGNTLYVTVINSGRFIEWVPLVTFYKEQIKI